MSVSRDHSLDVLRGMAVLLVLCCHYAQLNVSLLRLGGIGVDLFFVLSGFLISGLLFSELRRTEGIDLRRFFIRRGLKIYPVFFIFLIVTSPVGISVASFPRRLLIEFTFLQPYFVHVWEHTWSLGVEEHFYLVLPLLLLVLHRCHRLHWIPAITASLVVLCSVGRLFSVGAPSNTHLRIDELFDGVLLGYVRHYRPALLSRWSKPRWILPLALLLLVPWFVGPSQNISGVQSLRLLAASAGFSLFVIWTRRVELRSRVAEWIGRHSYSIYVWHVPFALIWNVYWPMSPLGFSTYLVTVIAFGAAISIAIELPILRLRDRIEAPGFNPRFPLTSFAPSKQALSLQGS